MTLALVGASTQSSRRSTTNGRASTCLYSDCFKVAAEDLATDQTNPPSVAILLLFRP